MLAPVIVFAYNRPSHLRQTLSLLAKNFLAKESAVYVFIDGPKNEDGFKVQQEVYNVATAFSTGYFKEMHIVNRGVNIGLAPSVISGVDYVIKKYGKVIVLEDDCLSDPRYIQFMNDALEFYKNQNNVWSVGGYTCPIEIPKDYEKDVLLVQRTSSMAWGTWIDRWEQIDWDVKDYKSFKWNFVRRNKFNKWGSDKSSMLDDQMNNRISSWAIRFEYAMFKNKMYNVLPRKSLIKNIGFDGSGTHCIANKDSNECFEVEINKNVSSPIKLEIVELDEKIRKAFCKIFHMGLFQRCKRFVGNLIYKIKKK